ncbi:MULTISPECIES: TraX family protein [unclassified Butyrivibrio]|uniref:TraX family protein n=1 Tax=unclassified Butyrivibrio TaxID=2639466 RepID=UPI0003B70C9D|nr:MULTISPECIES: TraX family protein [unclassified Butyrivibrio]SEL89937.1 TraX protein [Butyrivibrio sp. ob235]
MDELYNRLEKLAEALPRFDASTLKIVAVITMLIDHIGAGILLYLIKGGFYPFGGDFDHNAEIYYWIRHVGRQAFPIYCFMLTQGLAHTRSVPKYLRNLAIFGIISEPFFDYAVKIKQDVFSLDLVAVFNANREIILTKCNVFFTLLVGLISIWMMKYVEDMIFEEDPTSPFGVSAASPFHVLLYLAPLAAGCILTQVIQSDYRWWGVCLIGIFYVFRRSRKISCIIGYLFFMNMGGEAWSLPAFLLIMLYSGRPGTITRRFKYAFYAFYPLHLCLIYLVRCYMGKLMP